MNIDYTLIATVTCINKMVYITFTSSFTRDLFLKFTHTFKDSKYSIIKILTIMCPYVPYILLPNNLNLVKLFSMQLK